jgi:hypothetical protein
MLCVDCFCWWQSCVVVGWLCWWLLLLLLCCRAHVGQAGETSSGEALRCAVCFCSSLQCCSVLARSVCDAR